MIFALDRWVREIWQVLTLKEADLQDFEFQFVKQGFVALAPSLTQGCVLLRLGGWVHPREPKS
jgi:hypothetical protein